MTGEEFRAPWPEHFTEMCRQAKTVPAAQQAELCRCWQEQGDEEARNQLVECNIRFVVQMAAQYEGRGIDLRDLVQEGCLGIMEAADRYDSTKGFVFISYAVHWIRQAMMKAIIEAGTVRLPQSRAGANAQTFARRTRLEQQRGREISLEETAATLRQERRKEGKSYPGTDDGLMGKIYSLDAPALDNDPECDLSRAEYWRALSVEDDSSTQLIQQELTEIMSWAVADYAGRERQIIELYYGLSGEKPWTLEQIGTELNLTRERVRQIKDKLLEKARWKIKSRGLSQELLELVET